VKLASVPENLIERVGLVCGLVPTPFLDTMVALMLARTIMTAVKVGIFDVLDETPKSAHEIARFCETHPDSTSKLLRALSGIGYARSNNHRYRLSPTSARWLRPNCKHSFLDGILHRFIDGRVMETYENFVRSGEPVNVFSRLTPEEWRQHLKGQRSHAMLMISEVVRRVRCWGHRFWSE